MNDHREPPWVAQFARQFRIHNRLHELMDDALDRHGNLMRVPPDGPERHLSLLLHFSLAKAFKTFHAVGLLCRHGFGPDALILIRSSINLLINVAYVLHHPSPQDAAKNFWACSWKERGRYLKTVHGVSEMPGEPPMPEEEIEQRAPRWEETTIKQRAQEGNVPRMYYEEGYRLFSSLEHSDTSALLGYVSEWTESGPTLEGASERNVDLALAFNFQVMVDVLDLIFQYLQVPADEFRAQVKELSAELYQESGPPGQRV